MAISHSLLKKTIALYHSTYTAPLIVKTLRINKKQHNYSPNLISISAHMIRGYGSIQQATTVPPAVPEFDPIPPENPPPSPGPGFPGPPNPLPPGHDPPGPDMPGLPPEISPPGGPDVIPPAIPEIVPPGGPDVIPPAIPEIVPPGGPDVIPPKLPEPGSPYPTDIPPPIITFGPVVFRAGERF
uniref:Proline-rich protein 2-like n=1 Tax=Nicotiana tabacum TaxID=4097 RepID=A0A1S3Y8A4_TOBAC|nr:PREDICTED: proline-rich protein 2-like [Nicotiana tabacum]